MNNQMASCETKYTMKNFFDLSMDVLDNEHYLCFKARGISMHPFIRDNDLLKIKKTETSAILPGDLVFYRISDSRGVVHRVIRKTCIDRKIVFVTKGDACRSFDTLVHPDDIIGKVISVTRGGRESYLDKGVIKLYSLIYSGIAIIEVKLYSLAGKINSVIHRIQAAFLRRLQLVDCYNILIRKFIKAQDLTYRIAGSQDVHALTGACRSLHWPFKRSHYFRMLKEYLEILESQGYFFIAQKRDKIVGGIIIRNFGVNENFPAGWWTYGLFLNWCYRGAGIDEQLFSLAIHKGIEEGAQGIKMLAYKNDIFTMDLLKKFGFRQERVNCTADFNDKLYSDDCARIVFVFDDINFFKETRKYLHAIKI